MMTNPPMQGSRPRAGGCGKATGHEHVRSSPSLESGGETELGPRALWEKKPKKPQHMTTFPPHPTNKA